HGNHVVGALGAGCTVGSTRVHGSSGRSLPDGPGDGGGLSARGARHGGAELEGGARLDDRVGGRERHEDAGSAITAAAPGRPDSSHYRKQEGHHEQGMDRGHPYPPPTASCRIGRSLYCGGAAARRHAVDTGSPRLVARPSAGGPLRSASGGCGPTRSSKARPPGSVDTDRCRAYHLRPLVETRVVDAGRRYLLVSPCRDEASFMARTLDSVAAQSIPPALWIVVDDGSTDRTPEILAEYARRLPFLRVMKRADRGGRSVGPGVIEAFYAGLDGVDLDRFDYLCKLDMDLDLPPRYFELLIRR